MALIAWSTRVGLRPVLSGFPVDWAGGLVHVLLVVALVVMVFNLLSGRRSS